MGAQRRLLALPLAAVALSAGDPAASDFAADALSIEKLINEDYAYLERFPGGRMPMTEKLRAEAAAVDTKEELVRYAERALMLLADHHAITGSSQKDSWALVPSYSDLSVEKRAKEYVITAVRRGSPAEQAGVKQGDRLVAVGGTPMPTAVARFWADLGLPVTDERGGYAARLLAAGRRSQPRQLTIAGPAGTGRVLNLPNLYGRTLPDRPRVSANEEGPDLLIRIHDSLGSNDALKAFDRIMAGARPMQRVIVDLTDTPGGGNTTVARGILGWFVTRPTFYQQHSLPAEERQHGVARQWVEQVLPRAGKHHRGPVTVRVGRWTGSMGEGLAIGFDAIGARVEGDRMAGLRGAIYDYKLEKSGMVIKFPVERLFHVNGTPREQFVPQAARVHR
ncbi:MAG: PDZ domain-containing protein [Pseudomonadota bacterium]|nr:PDZ domain-containing protein [Pseudomonadota bacterium]